MHSFILLGLANGPNRDAVDLNKEFLREATCIILEKSRLSCSASGILRRRSTLLASSEQTRSRAMDAFYGPFTSKLHSNAVSVLGLTCSGNGTGSPYVLGAVFDRQSS